MKNFLLTLALAIGSFIGAKAQAYFVVVQKHSAIASTSANNLTFTTQQSGSTLTFAPPTGGYADSYYLTAGYTASSPSIIAPAYLSISANKTVKVTNNNSTSQKLAVRIQIVATNTSTGVYEITGTAVTVAAGATATLTIPSYSNYAYTAAWPTHYGTYEGYPIVLTFDIVAQ